NAGLETTANYIGNGVLALLRNPDQYELLRTDPTIARTAAEELLRYDTPAPIITPQRATVDLELGGRRIRAGALASRFPRLRLAAEPAFRPDPALRGLAELSLWPHG